MITEIVATDWLNKIDESTVAEAIAYLQTLDPSHELYYWQSNGDDHGVEISSHLTYQRKETPTEIAAALAARRQRDIEHSKYCISYFEYKLRIYPEAMPAVKANWQQRIDTATAKLKELP